MALSMLKEAINNKKVVIITYEGADRKVNPHLIGDTSTTSNCTLVAFQVGGYSKSNKMGWKQYTVNKIENIRLTDEVFTKNDGYNPNDSRMSRIICRI